MKDIKVISIRTNLPIALPVKKIKDNPLTLEIHGSRFNLANHVYINELEVAFTIISNQIIVVKVPTNIKQQSISSIAVTTEIPVLNQKNLIHFEFGNAFRSLDGFQRLIQHFVKILLQAPGSNIFNKTEGGGLLSFIGQNTINNGVPITSDIMDGVIRTKNIIIARQNARQGIPLDERLLDASVDNVSFGADKTSVVLGITLRNMAGTSLSTSLTV